MRKRRIAGLIAIATIVLSIALDIFFTFDLPRQNFLTHLIALVCLLFIGWCSFPTRGNRISAAFIRQDEPAGFLAAYFINS